MIQLTTDLPDPHQLIFSPDGRFLLVATNEGYRVWEVASREPRQMLRSFDSTPPIRFYGIFDISPAGRFLSIARMSGGGNRQALHGYIESGDWETLTEFDPREGTDNDDAGIDLHCDCPIPGATYTVFSPDGNYLAVGGAANRVEVLDISSWPQWKAHRGNAGPCRGLAFSPDSRRLATALDSYIRISDVLTGRLIGTIRHPCFINTGSATAIQDIAWLTDDNLIVLMSDRVYLFAIEKSDVRAVFEIVGRSMNVGNWMSVLPAAGIMSICGASGFKILDLATLQEVQNLSTDGFARMSAISPDGLTIALVIMDQTGFPNRLEIWDLDNI